MVLVIMILLASLSTHKSGVLLQLSKTIDQERTILLAQAGINEMLAAIKENINNPSTSVGNCIKRNWANKGPISLPKPVFNKFFYASNLKLSNKLARQQIGPGVSVNGQAIIVLTKKLNTPGNSYLGYVELTGNVFHKNSTNIIRVKERREIKTVDLSDPFLDKYALFVKSFCRSINNPAKRIIIQGVKNTDATKYSFIYLGNRSYPACPEFPKGSLSTKVPPVIVDLDFKADKKLLGSFYQPQAFATKSKSNSQASNGNLFFVSPGLSFAPIAKSFSAATDFHKTPELVSIYKTIINSGQKYSEIEGSLGYVIGKDYQKSGGNPANSEIFRSLVNSLTYNWKYHYGFSDFTSITGSSFTSNQPYSGINSYFKEMSQFNPQRNIGGKMPLFFGEKRDTPVYIEGPVYLRFFKVAFVDQVSVKFNLHGGNMLDVPFPTIPLRFERVPKTFSGKKLSTPIDKRTKKLMSAACDNFSINNFYFGANTISAKTPTSVNGKIEGYNVFPSLDESLRNITNIYETSKDFVNNRVASINGKKTIFLDGISLILGENSHTLDLSSVQQFKGKGKIIIAKGNCELGNLLPQNTKSDKLSIYLMRGRFKLKSKSQITKIRASLIATTDFNNNAISSLSIEGGIDFNNHNLELTGNLIVDNLFELANLPKGGFLKIIHDSNLYFPSFPVRTSISPTKSILACDYHAK